MRRRIRWILPLLVVAGLASVAAFAATSHASPPAGAPTATPIKHVVVIFQENVSFDHYFGTYPYATNTDGNSFSAAPGTPAVNGLDFSLLGANPNSANPHRLDSSVAGQLTCDQDHDYSDEQQAMDGGKMDEFVESVGTGSGGSPEGQPCQARQVMDYYDGNVVTGLWNYAQHYAMSDDSFGTTFGPSAPGAINLVSGNTGGVDTGHEANSPSVSTSTAPDNDITPDGRGGFSLTSDAQPYWDDCSTRDAVALKGQNVGDLLNARHISWGWFQGGFRPSTSYADALADIAQSGQPTSTFIPDEFKSFFSSTANRPAHSSNQALCSSVTPVGVALGGTGQWGFKDDYIPHHEPFEYYASTANPHHLAPTRLSAIGTDTQSYVDGQPQFDTANHNYDLSDFNALVAAITRGSLPASALPAVSFLKAPGYEDGHAAYSDPADEQRFVVDTVNELEQSPDWSSTAVIVDYDDSDGWYDHVFSPIVNPSHSVADNLTNTSFDVADHGTSGVCSAPRRHHSEGEKGDGDGPLAGEQGRCGFGPRLPLLVISPWAKSNYVDGNLSNQSSIINLVEYNWGLPGIKGSFDQILDPLDRHEGVRFDLGGMFDFGSPPDTTPYILDPTTGEPAP
ncbi:MAG TPA: alkaline phosphatase family protein [Gaiellaceae bacterium]|nr:alkaline phosphatase family protein [Gaiellaceae bacterium]